MERKVAAGADYFQTQAVFEPEKFIKFMEKAKQFGKPVQVGIIGVEIAARIIKECKPYCQGVHIMALGWESKIPDLLKLAEI